MMGNVRFWWCSTRIWSRQSLGKVLRDLVCTAETSSLTAQIRELLRYLLHVTSNFAVVAVNDKLVRSFGIC